MRQFIIFFLLLTGTGAAVQAQFNTSRLPVGGGGGGSMQRDTTKHEHEPDTLTLRYRYLDEPTDFMLDSSIYDFNLNYLRVPASYSTLGNNGTAARNLIFTPRMQAGFDPGFHAFDIYGFNHQNARFYTTTRPYSELGYLIGGQQEQMINLMHTQNRGQKFNFSFDYRKVNSPGFYLNQNTNHDTYRVTANYNSQNKRYHILMSYYLNKFNGGENGGIRADSFLHKPEYDRLRLIPTKLGGDATETATFFNTVIPVKNAYQEASFLLRQQYDWGRGDTVHVNDTTEYYKFDPVFRVEHTFTYTQNTYRYMDTEPDSTYYPSRYGFNILPANLGNDSVLSRHQWRILSNDLSLMQFPVRGNMAHFIRVGAGFDNIIGEFMRSSVTFQNLHIHGEYRNKTKNGKWDLQGRGELYLLGENAGDYMAMGTLSRYINDLFGNVSLMAKNVNKEPSYIYRYFELNHGKVYRNADIGKENITQLQFRADNRRLQYNLQANYYLFNKYTYFKSFSESEQFTGLFNMLQIIFHKRVNVGSFFWDADFAFQQIAGNAPINIPTIWTRHRFAYNGQLYKNLNLYTGIEAKYNTPFYADDYSPVLGQYFYQNTEQFSNYPEVAAFVHFRIKSFTAYVRAENLNIFVLDRNFYAPSYPSNNFALRVGLRWWYIN
ncbi:putative porin [Chitinophaga cymbidii]|uniref:Porin n=1 Tax=Chitinophaga cymbidii TaxID=1096750 RepID=A0A512RE43_9BACT|nr:putative porin [Chitinophaga cymbidii]GEP93962.1 hypothetical protein CCY01nite_02220 [Chitinophaga cymbidii]